MIHASHVADADWSPLRARVWQCAAEPAPSGKGWNRVGRGGANHHRRATLTGISTTEPYGSVFLLELMPRPKAAISESHCSPKASINTCWLMCSSLVRLRHAPPPARAIA